MKEFKTLSMGSNKKILRRTVLALNGYRSRFHPLLAPPQNDIQVGRHCEGAIATAAIHRSLSKVILDCFVTNVPRNDAFTLAEVLITLGIIGVVAAMTIPTLITNYQERKTVVALKKFYSVVSQSYRYALEEYGTPDGWYDGVEDPTNRTSLENSQVMGEKLTKYMKKTQDCQVGEKCFGDKYSKIDGNMISLPNGDLNSYPIIKTYVTLDGMSFFVNSYGANSRNLGSGAYSKSFGALTVDINGRSKPNVFGRDTFTFEITESAIVPAGGKNYATRGQFPSGCNRTDCYSLCEGCAAWVLDQGNMDYLHHDNLHW